MTPDELLVYTAAVVQYHIPGGQENLAAMDAGLAAVRELRLQRGKKRERKE